MHFRNHNTVPCNSSVCEVPVGDWAAHGARNSKSSKDSQYQKWTAQETYEGKEDTSPASSKEGICSRGGQPEFALGGCFFKYKRRHMNSWSRGSFFIGYSWTQESRSFCQGFSPSPFVLALLSSPLLGAALSERLAVSLCRLRGPHTALGLHWPYHYIQRGLVRPG